MTPFNSFSKVTQATSEQEHNDLKVSFEFFPPANATGKYTLSETVRHLSKFSPEFVSVTYGAGGGQSLRTEESIKQIMQESNLSPAAHVTCINSSCDEIDQQIQRYAKMGVKRIVALRGDLPGEGHHKKQLHNKYQNAAELVTGIQQLGHFDISVSAYPEGHPDSKGVKADLDYLKEKIDAGANRIITQYFFDNALFYEFVDRVRDVGITVPIVPGILPITNFKKVSEFSEKCGTSIPDWLKGLFEESSDQDNQNHLIAASVGSQQCLQLKAQGFREFHFYTLNQHELTGSICQMLNIYPNEVDVMELVA